MLQVQALPAVPMVHKPSIQLLSQFYLLNVAARFASQRANILPQLRVHPFDHVGVTLAHIYFVPPALRSS